jgi:toxin-antitoxin system PIN domain toxin
MDAVDTNILVYAHREDSPWHAAADRFVQELAEGPVPWAIPWPCLYEFYAIVTHPKIYRPPTPPGDALIQIERWLESPTLILLHEDERFWDSLRSLVASAAVKGGAVHDARVAALCVRHGIKVLHSADRDFSRFPNLRTKNPLRTE